MANDNSNDVDMSNAKIYTTQPPDMDQQIYQDKMADGYNEFSEHLKNNPDISREMIISIFRFSDAKEWPMQYYKARDKIWPIWFGEKGTAFLIQYLLNGNPLQNKENMSIQDIKLLDSWYLLFSETVNKAETYALNPMGLNYIDSVWYKNDTKRDYLIRIYRKDGNAISLSVEPENIMGIITQLINFLPEMEKLYNRKMDYTPIQELLKKMDHSPKE